MDDRFEEDSTVFKKAEPAVSKRLTLEDSLKLAIAKGSDLELKNAAILIAMLPEDRKEHYRALWKAEVERRRGINGPSKGDE
jgi:hypothetical protein